MTALNPLDFSSLIFLIASVILRSFESLDSLIIVSYPTRDVSLLDFLLAFSVLAVISDFIYHTFHVGGGGDSSSSPLNEVDPDNIVYVPLSEYLEDLE